MLNQPWAEFIGADISTQHPPRHYFFLHQCQVFIGMSLILSAMCAFYYLWYRVPQCIGFPYLHCGLILAVSCWMQWMVMLHEHLIKAPATALFLICLLIDAVQAVFSATYALPILPGYFFGSFVILCGSNKMFSVGSGYRLSLCAYGGEVNRILLLWLIWTSGKNHKAIKEGYPWLLQIYYNNRPLLFTLCAANELFFQAIYIKSFYNHVAIYWILGLSCPL